MVSTAQMASPPRIPTAQAALKTSTPRKMLQAPSVIMRPASQHPVQIPLSLLFLELSGHYVNAVQLYVNATDALVRCGILARASDNRPVCQRPPLAQRQAVAEVMSRRQPLSADDYRDAIAAMRDGGSSRAVTRRALLPTSYASARRLGALTPAGFDAILADVWPEE
jgi:hypothetical protein